MPLPPHEQSVRGPSAEVPTTLSARGWGRGPCLPVNPFPPAALRAHPSRPGPSGRARALRTEVQKLLHGQRGRGELAEVLDVLGRPCQGRVLQQRAEPAHGGGLGLGSRSARPGSAQPGLAVPPPPPRPGRPPEPGQSAGGGSLSPPMAAHKQLRDSQSRRAPARGFPPGPAPWPGLARSGLLFASGRAESPPPRLRARGQPFRPGGRDRLPLHLFPPRSLREPPVSPPRTPVLPEAGVTALIPACSPAGGSLSG